MNAETESGIKPGVTVEVRDASGCWHTTVARSEPRADEVNAIGRHCYVTVAVDHAGYDHPVNWPVEDVRLPT